MSFQYSCVPSFGRNKRQSFGSISRAELSVLQHQSTRRRSSSIRQSLTVVAPVATAKEAAWWTPLLPVSNCMSWLPWLKALLLSPATSTWCQVNACGQSSVAYQLPSFRNSLDKFPICTDALLLIECVLCVFTYVYKQGTALSLLASLVRRHYCSVIFSSIFQLFYLVRYN